MLLRQRHTRQRGLPQHAGAAEPLYNGIPPSNGHNPLPTFPPMLPFPRHGVPALHSVACAVFDTRLNVIILSVSIIGDNRARLYDIRAIRYPY